MHSATVAAQAGKWMTGPAPTCSGKTNSLISQKAGGQAGGKPYRDVSSWNTQEAGASVIGPTCHGDKH